MEINFHTLIMKELAKNITTLIVVLLLTVFGFIGAQAQEVKPQGNYFVGIYKPVGNCQDEVLVVEQVNSNAQYTALQEKFQKEHAKESPRIYRILPDQNATIILYRTQVSTASVCKPLEYHIRKGENFDAIRNDYLDIYNRYKANYVAEPVEVYRFKATAKPKAHTISGVRG